MNEPHCICRCQRTGGFHAAIRFLESVRQSRLIRKIYSDEELENQAEKILRLYADQDFSFTDAVSFATMRQLNITEAFAFDHHFVTAGFRVLPATS